MPNKILKFLWKYCKDYKIILLFYAVLWIVFAIICDSGMNYSLKLLIDKFTIIEDENIFSYIFFPLILYLSLFITISILMVLYQYIKLISLNKIENNIREDVFSYVEKHSYSYFTDNESGDIGNKLNNIPQATLSILDTILQYTFSNGLSLIITTILLYKVNMVFSILFAIWFICFVISTILFAKKQVNCTDNLNQSISLFSGLFLDIISNIFIVKSFAMEKLEQNNINNSKNDIYKKQIKSSFCNIKAEIYKQGFMVLLMISTIFFIIKLKQENSISNGDIVFVLTSICGMAWTCNWVSGIFINTTNEIGKLKNSLNLLSIPYSVKDLNNAKEIIINKSCIEFNNVYFSYEGNIKKIFENFNLKINPYEKIAIVGASGSGKTTLIKLLLRYYDINKGEILIDNQNISHIKQESLRKNISFIPQLPILFHRTILDNIKYGKLDATFEEVQNACKIANCYDFINELENGFYTDVGENGDKLSGGQKQRIAIARAVLKNSPILILDEATNSLDNYNEKLVNESINKLMMNKTVIVIAHKLETIINMDKIVVLENGKIVEVGNHNDLINCHGKYFEFYNDEFLH